MIDNCLFSSTVLSSVKQMFTLSAGNDDTPVNAPLPMVEILLSCRYLTENQKCYFKSNSQTTVCLVTQKNV